MLPPQAALHSPRSAAFFLPKHAGVNLPEPRPIPRCGDRDTVGGVCKLLRKVVLLVILVTVTEVFALSVVCRQSVEIELLTLNPHGYPDKQIFVAGRTATILLSRHCRNFLRLRSAGPGFAI